MNVEYKSTGTLLDELFTTDLKLEHWPDNEEVQQRRHALGNAVTVRLLKYHESTNWEKIYDPTLQSLTQQLKTVLRSCWNAQEVVMQFTHAVSEHNAMTYETLLSVVTAAITAQRTNAERNKLIRQLDNVLLESDNTQLAKTYADKDEA